LGGVGGLGSGVPFVEGPALAPGRAAAGGLLAQGFQKGGPFALFGAAPGTEEADGVEISAGDFNQVGGAEEGGVAGGTFDQGRFVIRLQTGDIGFIEILDGLGLGVPDPELVFLLRLRTVYQIEEQNRLGIVPPEPEAPDFIGRPGFAGGV
jgi:hypothetical protein